MPLPTKSEAVVLLTTYVQDHYQRHHACMVGTVLEQYAKILNQDEELWFLTGYLHDIDYEQFPNQHPGPSLQWFSKWQFPTELIHAVEAHAYGFNGFTTIPTTQLARGLIACDEICGIFYAYKKINPIPYNEMKVNSLLKRLKEPRFAPNINREHIYTATKAFNLSIEEHVTNIRNFLSAIDTHKDN